MTATTLQRATFLQYLTPTALAALSVELEDVADEAGLLGLINSALVANVGEDDADELRQWYRENI